MPEFYFVPKKLARKAPVLVRIAQSVEAALFRIVFWLIRKLSLEHALTLAGSVFAFTARLSDKTEKADTNLAIAFPDASPEWRRQTTREIFRHLGYSIVELIKLEQIWEERDDRVDIVLEPGAREHMESGRATVFVTGHIGPWQVTPVATKHYGFKNSTIYAPESNPVLSELMLELRKFFGEQLISNEEGARPLLRELKAGNSLNVAMDTRPDTGKLIPFFGKDALTNTSAVGLALKTGASLILARGERLPNARYRITVYGPLESPIPDEPLKEQAAALTEIIHGYFEQWIKADPEQWICLKRRWPKPHKL